MGSSSDAEKRGSASAVWIWEPPLWVVSLPQLPRSRPLTLKHHRLGRESLVGNGPALWTALQHVWEESYPQGPGLLLELFGCDLGHCPLSWSDKLFTKKNLLPILLLLGTIIKAKALESKALS